MRTPRCKLLPVSRGARQVMVWQVMAWRPLATLRLLGCVLVSLVMWPLAFLTTAFAQEFAKEFAKESAQQSERAFYSGKTVRMIVGSGAGGGYDAFSRLIAPYLAKTLGATVVVENQPGAGGLVALNRLY